MTPLRKRRLLLPKTALRYPLARSFHAPQRDHVKSPMPARKAAGK